MESEGVLLPHKREMFDAIGLVCLRVVVSVRQPIGLSLFQLDLIETLRVLQHHLCRSNHSLFHQSTPIHLLEEIVCLDVADIFGTKAFSGIFVKQFANEGGGFDREVTGVA